MLQCDLADSPLASEWPDIADAIDTLEDRLKDAVAPYLRTDDKAIVFTRMREELAREGITSTQRDQAQIIVNALHAIYSDTRHASEIRIIAKAGMIALSKTGESYQAAADEFGVTRACIHAHARRIETATGIRPRRAKSDEARAKSVAAATGKLRNHFEPGPAWRVRKRRCRLIPCL